MATKHGPALPCSRLAKRIRRPERTVPINRCQPRPRTGQTRPPCKSRGNAIIEVVASLLALMPFVIGIPVLGKHFDVRHKTFDAARYAVWERTVWRDDHTVNRKDDRDVELEIHDRILGDPTAGLISAASVQTLGTSENTLWRDSASKSLLDYRDGLAPVALQQQRTPTPVDVGRVLGPALAHGYGSSTAATALGIDDLRFSRETFARATVSLGLRGIVARRSGSAIQSSDDTPSHALTQRANAAILSDTWSARDERYLGCSVDRLTADELIESLELPGRFIAMQAPAKGKALYGEGQFAAGVDLRPSSATLPAAYVNGK
jgi:hypothetical protein